MKILLVDDEAGIREGLAAFLRMKGHEVVAAGSCAEAVEIIEHTMFELIVTDWHLEDGLAEPVLEHAQCQVIVISGFPEQVQWQPHLLKVLPKPVPPKELAEEIRELHKRDEMGQGAVLRPAGTWQERGLAGLPLDTSDRFRLLMAVFCVEPEQARILDDGTYTTLRIPLNAQTEVETEIIGGLGGDLRVVEIGERDFLEYRVFRDGRPDGVEKTVTSRCPWPNRSDLAVDLDGESIAPQDFLALLERIADHRQSGGSIALLNVPSHLRLLAEGLGRGAELPMRRSAGPRMPAVLAGLWS